MPVEILRLETRDEGPAVVLSTLGPDLTELKLDYVENGTFSIAALLDTPCLLELHTALTRLIRGRVSESFENHHLVEVRDDHDGGSVWLVEEYYMEADDARDLAVKLSRQRENRAARIKLAMTEVVAEYENGEVVASR